MTRLLLLILACACGLGCKTSNTSLSQHWDSRDENAPSPMEQDDRLSGWEQYWRDHPEQNKVMNEAFGD